MATTKKKTSTRSSVRTTGNKNLKTGKKISRAQILVIVLAVAAAGTYMVYRSLAGSYVFGRTPKQMSGGTLREKNGVYRRNISSRTNDVRASISTLELNRTSKICTTVIVNENLTSTATIRLGQHTGPSKSPLITSKNGPFKVAQRVQLCGRPVYWYSSSIYVKLTDSRNSSHSVGVLSIYGL